jgi:hypothetical protein
MTEFRSLGARAALALLLVVGFDQIARTTSQPPPAEVYLLTDVNA